MDDGVSGITGYFGHDGLLDDESRNETGGVSPQLFSEFAETNEKKVCPHCFIEIRAGYEEVCFFCKGEIWE